MELVGDNFLVGTVALDNLSGCVDHLELLIKPTWVCPTFDSV